nr:hypothetical protein CFP56_69376 [Quercus suber]
MIDVQRPVLVHNYIEVYHASSPDIRPFTMAKSLFQETRSTTSRNHGQAEIDRFELLRVSNPRSQRAPCAPIPGYPTKAFVYDDLIFEFFYASGEYFHRAATARTARDSSIVSSAPQSRPAATARLMY